MKSVFIRVYPWLLITTHLMAADPISDALQKGLFEEEANHNLDAAIKAYQSVIDQTAEQRKLTATAVFRLGECYRKLNKTNEAVFQYQRAVREFSDQTNLLAVSQKTLTVLGAGSIPGERPRLTTAPPAEDPEAKEIKRLKSLTKDSPDLVNAKDDQGDTPLHRAVSRGQLKVAEFLLANKAEVNTGNSKRTMPLHYAVWYGQKSIVESLLLHGADVNAFGSLGSAAADKITPYWCQPLHIAAHRGNQAITELLLKHKAQLNGLDYRNRTPLHFAVDQGFLGVARLLLSNGADINLADDLGRTPAMLAASAGYENIFRVLVESGGDINAQDKQGNTLAHYAARQRSLGMLKAVLSRKPDLEIEDKPQQTPLIAAVLSRNTAGVELLLQAGANPDRRTQTGAFALMAAVDTLHEEAVRLLLAAKADPNQANFEGMTALNRAVAKNLDTDFSPSDRKALREIADWLRNAGAKDSIARTPFIGIARDQDHVVNAQFIRQDAQGLNRFTLFELLHAVYSGRGPYEGTSSDYTSLKFPDFTRIRIDRLVNGEKGRKRIELNLDRALLEGDCTANVPLEWGDIVEIPEGDHKLNEAWTGLPPQIRQTLTACLSRDVEFELKGEVRRIKLHPGFWTSGGALVAGAAPGPGHVLHWFRLKNVVAGSGLLRASSDLKRVEVVRKMSDTGESLTMTFNVEGSPGRDDLILRDGDIIRVREKL